MSALGLLAVKSVTYEENDNGSLEDEEKNSEGGDSEYEGNISSDFYHISYRTRNNKGIARAETRNIEI